MNNDILTALQTIDVSQLDYQEWINVGMALKAEGLPCSVWDDWSRNDTRYRPGECERKWASFQGATQPVTAGTIIKMAKERGYQRTRALTWDDWIEDDGDGMQAFSGFSTPSMSPSEELIKYIETLFESEEYVGYVTNDVWQNSDGVWVPSKGVYSRTAGEIVNALKKFKDDIGCAIDDWKPEAGAWIRFNPVDGQGVKNENVTRFSYALVESDSMPLAEQEAMYRKLELPIATLVYSGGKSLHAIVHVDAPDADEYRKRVEFLYDFLEKNGVQVDKQNRNPSRLSRMPGVTRGDKRQTLVATNIGRKSWVDWMDFVEGVQDELPPIEQLSALADNPPELPPAIIDGVLRQGHKMLISGSSKAGKSFLLMELAIALAHGEKWLGFQCQQGRVLYINLEIDRASAINRFMEIYKKLGEPYGGKDISPNIDIWNLRGKAVPLNELVPRLVRRVRDIKYIAIIIDPIYKVITGDENNASEMGAFCNQFDKICAETGASVIYCHHHSKGAQGMKKAMDRASGSGVFARDPDAQLDMIELEMTDSIRNYVREGNSTAWRLESSLREFENIKPVNFWFDYPIHRVDESGELKKAKAEGEPSSYEESNERRATDKAESFRNAFDILQENGEVSVKDMSEYLGCTRKAIYGRIKKQAGEFTLKDGKIVMNDN